LRRRLIGTANMTAMERTAGGTGNVTIVVQTRVRPESDTAFAAWQVETSRIVAGFPGFVERTVMPPSPPAQVDWVILQRFVSTEAAVAWLNSEQRQKRLEGAAPMLVGPRGQGAARSIQEPSAQSNTGPSQPRQHAAHLRTVPFAGTGRRGDAAPVQLGCNGPQASSAARL
jgi:hypothetical protein